MDNTNQARNASDGLGSLWAGLCIKTSCSGVINTFPIFGRIAEHDSSWGKEYFVEGDVHFNERGNAVVSSELEKYFINSRLPLADT